MAKPKTLGDTELVVSEVVVQTFGFYPAAESWTPAMNAFETEDAVELFFDLADVPRESIEVTAEPGRLILCGRRVPPTAAVRAGPYLSHPRDGDRLGPIPAQRSPCPGASGSTRSRAATSAASSGSACPCSPA